jgi:hypothetical protein
MGREDVVWGGRTVIDPTEFEKGAVLPAIVEQVNSGSSVRITLLEGLRSVGVLVCGITCPSMGRWGPPPPRRGMMCTTAL